MVAAADIQFETMVFMVLVSIMTVLCILLNAIGIYAFFKLPRTPANLVYLHLCITDLIVGIFVTPYSIILLKNGLENSNESFCTMQGIMFEISYTTTLFILTYISVDRLIALYRPLKYKKVMSARVLFWINIATWIVPIVRPIARYTINYFLKTYHTGSEEDYQYTNDNFFMVCYNSDYIDFVKISDDESNGFSSTRLKMLDQCIIIVACQAATLISSILVVARLSHRLHIKRIARGAPQASTVKRQSVSGPNNTTTPAVPDSVVVQQPQPRTHHFHPSPENYSTTICSTNAREDDLPTLDGTLGEDSSGDSAGVRASRRLKSRKKKREAERHAIVTMVTVIVFFMVTYTPSFICFIVPGIYKGREGTDEIWVFLLIDYCTFVNSTFLPMVHFSRSSGFKSQLKHLARRVKRVFRGGSAGSRRAPAAGTTAAVDRNKTVGTELVERNGMVEKTIDSDRTITD